MKSKFFSRIDYILLIFVLILVSIGISFIYSSGLNENGIQEKNEYIKQIVWACIGLVLLFITFLFDYRKLERYSFFLYIGMLCVLLFVCLFGKEVNSSRSWIGIGSFGIQPSEISKIIYIIFLAKYLVNSKSTNPFKRFIIALMIMLIPMGLILLQPDLGTATVFFPIFIFMCYFANVNKRYLIFLLAFSFLSILLTVLPYYTQQILNKNISFVNILSQFSVIFIISFSTIAVIGLVGYLLFKKKYFFWITCVSGILASSFLFSILASKVLKPYQIQRLIIFLDPSKDPLNSGWNLIQSKIAIGSGSVFGRGFKQGIQSHYNYLPEQSTDFIFSIFAEETGFVGGIIVFLLFLFILLRILFIIKNNTDNFGCYICAGIMAMIFFHFIVNVGMVMGIMPITGIPLPFLSYGGSALLTNMISIGLVMSISSRRLDFSVGI